MDKFNRIYNLHKILSDSKYPVARKSLEDKLACSKATVNRLITESRDFLDAPIEYDQRLNGYYYDKKTTENYELPGLWFNASELHALLAAYQLLSQVQPGFLGPHIAPLKKRIEGILHKEKYESNEVFRRVRILQIGGRKYSQKHFAMVTTALLNGKQLEIEYHAREKDQETKRTLSPQRLVYYRDNWYLDAWCHLRQGLRSFSMDRIKATRLVNLSRLFISDDDLNQHYANAYGIFAGKATDTAKLRFNKHAAQWVSAEHWHKEQNGQFDLDGSYTLNVPYSDPRELIRDILKYGPNVEVIAPDKLRQEVASQITQAAKLYNT